MKSALKFSSKVWLTTILVGPMIMGVKIYFLYDWIYDRWANAFLVPEIGIPLGILYFLPSWFILSLSRWYFLKRNLATKSIKVYLGLIALILGIAPFAFMDFHSLFTINTGFMAGFPPDLFWTITYVSLTVAGVWFYKLKPVDNPSSIVEASPK